VVPKSVTLNNDRRRALSLR